MPSPLSDLSASPGLTAQEATSLPDTVFERRDISLEQPVLARRTSLMVSSLRSLSIASSSSSMPESATTPRATSPNSFNSKAIITAPPLKSLPGRSASLGNILCTRPESEIGVHSPFGQKSVSMDFDQSRPGKSNPKLTSKLPSAPTAKTAYHNSNILSSTDILFPSLLEPTSSRKRSSKSYQPARAVLPTHPNSHTYYGNYQPPQDKNGNSNGPQSSGLNSIDPVLSGNLSPTSKRPRRPSRLSISSLSSIGTTAISYSSSSSSLSSLSQLSTINNLVPFYPSRSTSRSAPPLDNNYYDHNSSPPALSPTSNTTSSTNLNGISNISSQPHSRANSSSDSSSTSNSNSNSNSSFNLRFTAPSRPLSLSMDQTRSPLYVPVVLRFTPANYGFTNGNIGEASTITNDRSYLTKLSTHLENPKGSGGDGGPLAIPRDHWVPNNQRSKCNSCSKPFGSLATGGLFPRRHHCRKCGEIFCKNCCQFWLKLDHLLNYVPDNDNAQLQRCCLKCANKMCLLINTDSPPSRPLGDYDYEDPTTDTNIEIKIKRKKRVHIKLPDNHRYDGDDYYDKEDNYNKDYADDDDHNDDDDDDISSDEEEDEYNYNRQKSDSNEVSTVPRAWLDNQRDQGRSIDSHQNPHPYHSGLIVKNKEIDQSLVGISPSTTKMVPVDWDWSTF